ncbi:MAG TPA: alpha/beta hydrolase [Pseudonocardiaceae bacterium]|nr:alpha/beta hydrolase [Pseudonocardiaceae bacterium]
MAISDALGTEHTVTLPGGPVRYRERGTGPAVLFVHGLLVNADLWRAVVPPVADAGFRCLAPDWPLGAHRDPLPPSADLSPPGVARMIADFLAELELTDVTVVANDTGGALTQILMTEHPGRVGRVVLTPCDALDKFFPQPFTALPTVIRFPGADRLIAASLRVKPLWPQLFGMLMKKLPTDDVMRSFVDAARDPGIRRDVKRFTAGVHKRYTLRAAEALPDFDRPVLLVGAGKDKVFPDRLREGLAARLPKARQVVLEDSYTFVPEDQPAELARLIVEFMRSG